MDVSRTFDTTRFRQKIKPYRINEPRKPPYPMNKERLQSLARDLRKTPPRSPRETLGGFVIAARMLDKARADLLGIHGEYNFYPCGLGAYFCTFTGLDAQ